MAHVLSEGKKNRPIIIPVVPKGQIPPGCLSKYQPLEVDTTFWLSKLTLDFTIAVALGGLVVHYVPCLPEVKARAFANLKDAPILDFQSILGFLHSHGALTFNEILNLTNQVILHSAAYKSDFIMSHMYSLLNKHVEELKKNPAWVAAWTRLHERYQQFKAEERRRQEESARRILEQMNSSAQESRGKAES